MKLAQSGILDLGTLSEWAKGPGAAVAHSWKHSEVVRPVEVATTPGRTTGTTRKVSSWPPCLQGEAGSLPSWSHGKGGPPPGACAARYGGLPDHPGRCRAVHRVAGCGRPATWPVGGEQVFLRCCRVVRGRRNTVPSGKVSGGPDAQAERTAAPPSGARCWMGVRTVV